MNNRPGVMLYFSILPALDSLSPASAGTLLLAAMHYAQDGREPIFEDGTLSFAWSFLKPSIDRDGDVYEEKRLRGSWMTYCRQCKREGNEPLDFETWRQRNVTEPLHTETDTTPISMSDPLSNSMSVSDSVSNKNIADKPPAPARKKFVPLTLEEVRQYCDERKNGIDAQHFLDYYEARGWKYNGGQALKDWRAAIRTWERNGNSKPQQSDRNRLRTSADYEAGTDFFGGGD